MMRTMRTLRTPRMTMNTAVSATSSRVVLVGLALAAGALTTGCGGEEQTRPPPEVTVAQPITRAVHPYVDFTGTTRAIESVEIRARVGGVLEQQLFEPSQIVNEGETLFVIEQDVYQASRDEAVALLRSAIADSALKESNLERIQTGRKPSGMPRRQPCSEREPDFPGRNSTTTTRWCRRRSPGRSDAGEWTPGTWWALVSRPS